MLSKCKLLNCMVEIDREKTEQWYAQAEDWGCECGDCINFLEVAKRALLPSHIYDLLASLHIPATKATYVCLLNSEDLYEFSYRIAGNILFAESEWEEDGCCCHEWYPYGAPDFPTPHFDIKFVVELPRVL
ncbi:MAG: hypothetical protein IKK00_08090 [Oscillospiraceae bacterium]|nr:hypothetical protein [Oscillospiraceae bacterium]